MTGQSRRRQDHTTGQSRKAGKNTRSVVVATGKDRRKKGNGVDDINPL